MSLRDTLSRRRKLGGDEGTITPLDPTFRHTLCVDNLRVVKQYTDSGVGNIDKLLHNVQFDILQHVFAGHEPAGPELTQVRRQRLQNSWPFIVAYIKDATSDLESLDAIAILLDAWERAANQHRPMTTQWENLPGVEPPEYVQYVKSVDSLISIINMRLSEWGIGYRYAAGRMIRSPEPTLVDESIVPCLVALRRDQFKDVEAEFARCLAAWRTGDHKQVVHHAGESIEGMLRVLTQHHLPKQHSPTDQTNSTTQKLNNAKILKSPYKDIIKGITALRGDLGAHSEATKPDTRRANSRDSTALVFLSASMLVYLAALYDLNSPS